MEDGVPICNPTRVVGTDSSIMYTLMVGGWTRLVDELKLCPLQLKEPFEGVTEQPQEHPLS